MNEHARQPRVATVQPAAERGLALLAVLFALTLLMLLALPFAVSMSVGADAAMRDVEQTSTEQASASVRELLLLDVALSHPAIDPTPLYDGLDEWPQGVDLPPAFAGLADGGRVLLGGEVTDLQRFLALDSASPLLLANVLDTAGRLQEDLEPDATSCTVGGANGLPESGYVWVGGEVISYELREGGLLSGLQRGLFREQGFADGSEPIAAEALVLDYRCVLAAIWPFFGRDPGSAGASTFGGPSRAVRQPWRSVGELLEIQAAGLGTFTTAEIDALARTFAVDTQAEDSATWGRPERVFNDLVAGVTRTLTVKSAVHVGAGSTVRLRDLSTGVSEYGLVMSTATQAATQQLLLPSVFQLDLLLPVSQAFRGGDTVVEPLVPAPVNLNTAPPEVLAAVFANVRRSADLRVNHADGRRNSSPPSISPQLADELAAEIVAGRDPGSGSGAFTGWQDLVTRVFEPRLAAEGGNTGRNKWVVLYRNLQSGRDSILEMGTSPICFKSGPWVRYRAAASRSRSLVAAGVVGRHERTGLAAALPGFRVEHAWTTQQQFEQAFLLDRRAPYWITSPINLGHLQPGDLGNDPSARYFAHLVPVAFPGLGLGAPRYAVDDEADSGIEPGVSTTPANIWARGNNAPRAFDSFAQANHRRGRDVQRDGPYAMNNTGPMAQGAAGGSGGQGGGAQGGGPGRHDQLSFPFSEQGGFMGRYGIGFWLEPQTLENRIVLDHSDGNPDRNRLSVLGRDGNLVFEVIDEAGIDPNPSDSPAGVVRTASRVELPLAELGLPADTAVHLNVSATSGRPADLSFQVDGMTRGKPKFVTYLTAGLPVFDPSLGNNRTVPGQRGNDRYVDLQVESTEGFPPTGILRVGLELFEYSSISGNSFQCQWRDSLGGRGARQRGREFRPAIPVDPNTGEPTVDFDDPQFQGVNLDVFPEHPAGSLVELYGYAALVSEDTAMMVGSTNLSGAVGGFAVARGFVQSGRPIVMAPLQGQTIQVGVGIDATWTGDLELADPVATGKNGQPPAAAQQQIADAFALDGGYALLIQRRRTFNPNLPGQVGGTPAEVGGIELIRYGARQGTRLTGVQRAQTLPGQDNQINRSLYDGTARQFVTDWTDWPLNGNNQLSYDDVPTLILWVVPISLAVQNTGALWDPQQTQLTEWLQLRPQGSTPEDTEWVRYDAIVDGRFVVRSNRGAWRDLSFQLTQTLAGERIDYTQFGPNQTPDVIAPPWGTVQATAGYIGYVPQLESLFPQILRARQALRFRGDPFTETSSHPQNNSQVTACQRLQLVWGNHSAYTGRVGRHDRIALVQGSIASGTSRPAVEWHTVTWQARRFGSDNLQQNQQPEELLGPWPFQLVAFKDGVRNIFIGPPRGTVVTDPRQFDRLVKFPSGELPAAFCQNPTVGAGANGEQPMQGLVDEVEVVAHIASDLVLDETFSATAQTFTVNRYFSSDSAGAQWSQTDLSAAFPQAGGLVQIDTEILGYQSVADGVFQVAQNGRGLLNTQPRDHDRGARVKFLTHRPAAILAGGVGAQESSLPLQAIGPLPRAGTLLMGRELLHYCWARSQVNTLEMPRWYPPALPGERVESAGRGLFRGRYGTAPQGASSGEVVIAWPFRYWDRYAEQSDDPELAYFQLTSNEAPVFFRDLRWREETRDARVELICRVRTDSLADWTADPQTTPGLWEFRGGQDQARRHQLGRQAARLEVRFMTAYRPGAIDLQSFTAHGWKTSSRVEDVRVEYEGQGRIFDERVTAR